MSISNKHVFRGYFILTPFNVSFMIYSGNMLVSNDLPVIVGGTVGTVVLLIIGVVMAVFFLRYT